MKRQDPAFSRVENVPDLCYTIAVRQEGGAACETDDSRWQQRHQPGILRHPAADYPEGLYTNAIYGFLNILHKLCGEEVPDALCVAFDLKAPTFRHQMYEGYKATRHGMPDELAMQMPVMKQVLGAMRIPIYELEGWEADDILGTVGRRCGEEDWDCVIVTGDRDSLQLVDGHVTVKLVSTKGGQTTATRYDEVAFQAEYGFEPRRLIDLKSLMATAPTTSRAWPALEKRRRRS